MSSSAIGSFGQTAWRWAPSASFGIGVVSMIGVRTLLRKRRTEIASHLPIVMQFIKSFGIQRGSPRHFLSFDRPPPYEVW
ncbi:MAG: hypothetical protein K940chlam8_01254 [Chlamydiae bacterium]|nr:hypothetical protein [Chlamydiota bacterium]